MADTTFDNTRETAVQLGTLVEAAIRASGTVGESNDIGTKLDPRDYFKFRVEQPGIYKVSVAQAQGNRSKRLNFMLFEEGSTKFLRSAIDDPGFPAFSSFKEPLQSGKQYYLRVEDSSSGSTPNLPSTFYDFSISVNNFAPGTISLFDLQGGYESGATVNLTQLYAQDKDGWGDLNKLDLWLTDPNGNRVELPDVSNFAPWSGGNTWADLDYSFSTVGLSAGTYQLNIQSYDSAGQTSKVFQQTFAIQPLTTSLPIIQFSQATAYQASEGAGNSTVVTLTRSGNIDNTSQVEINVTGGTATAGSDYANTGFPLTVDFAAGESSKTVAIPILQDATVENTETINFSIGSISNAAIGSSASATLQILDDDQSTGGTGGTANTPTIQFSKATYAYVEGDGRAAIELIRSGVDLNVTSQVTLSVTGGTATNGADYIDSQPIVVVTFNPGETTKRLSTQIVQDGLIEPDETLTLSLSSPSGATLGTQTTSQITIRDDDTAASITGGSANDTLRGTDQDNTLTGNAGNDLLTGFGGNDVLVGGIGNDSLQGGFGNDNLQGGDGNDVLFGTFGSDVLAGGAGSDQFSFATGSRFSKASIGVATITDFTKGEDKIVISRKTFTAKRLTFASVRNVAQAKSSNATLTYVRKTGSLFYNQNGAKKGFGTGGLFADLTNGLTLANSDISITN